MMQTFVRPSRDLRNHYAEISDIAVFKRDRFDRYSNFARIGDGSLGGKGRGLAFIDNMVKHHRLPSDAAALIGITSPAAKKHLFPPFCSPFLFCVWKIRQEHVG